VTALRERVDCAVTPGDDAQRAHPAASATSAQPIASAARLRVEEASRHSARATSGSGRLASDVDRGSPTANQMDTVHVSICCDSGTA
jgi:hypothetical protein